MDIKEAQKLKKDLEEKLEKILYDFTKKTGLNITKVNIDTLKELCQTEACGYLVYIRTEI